MPSIAVRTLFNNAAGQAVSDILVDITLDDPSYKMTLSLFPGQADEFIKDINNTQEPIDIDKFITQNITAIARIDFYKDGISNDGPAGQPSTLWIDREGRVRNIFHRQNGRLTDGAKGEAAAQTLDEAGYVTTAASYRNGIELHQLSPTAVKQLNSHLPARAETEPRYGRHFRPPGS